MVNVEAVGIDTWLEVMVGATVVDAELSLVFEAVDVETWDVETSVEIALASEVTTVVVVSDSTVEDVSVLWSELVMTVVVV